MLRIYKSQCVMVHCNEGLDIVRTRVSSIVCGTVGSLSVQNFPIEQAVDM